MAAGIASILALKIGKRIGSIVQKVDYKKLVLGIIIGLLITIYIFTGIVGIVISIVGAAIGLIPQLVKTKKTFALGCLILPTILFFFGILFEVLSFIGI